MSDSEIRRLEREVAQTDDLLTIASLSRAYQRAGMGKIYIVVPKAIGIMAHYESLGDMPLERLVWVERLYADEPVELLFPRGTPYGAIW